MSDTFSEIKAIIVDLLGVDESKVTMDARFREDLEADSLDLVELIMASRINSVRKSLMKMRRRLPPWARLLNTSRATSNLFEVLYTAGQACACPAHFYSA